MSSTTPPAVLKGLRLDYEVHQPGEIQFRRRQYKRVTDSDVVSRNSKRHLHPERRRIWHFLQVEHPEQLFMDFQGLFGDRVFLLALFHLTVTTVVSFHLLEERIHGLGLVVLFVLIDAISLHAFILHEESLADLL